MENINYVAKEFMVTIKTTKVFAFIGKMGAGKTTFISAICKTLNVKETVNSPTFSIINEYYSDLLDAFIYHFDFYRIKSIYEAIDLGVEEYFNNKALCFIEWPKIIECFLPKNTIWVSIKENSDNLREIQWNKKRRLVSIN